MIEEIKTLIKDNGEFSQYTLQKLSGTHRQNWIDIVSVNPKGLIVENEKVYVVDTYGVTSLVNIMATDVIYQIYINLSTDIALVNL